MIKSKCHLNTDYSSKFRKRFVQTLLYTLSHVRGNVLMLCGPALKEHLRDAKIILYKKSKCIIYENNIETFYQNTLDLPKTSTYKIELILDSINNAKVERFVDLDFCSRLDTNLHIIEDMFNKMNNIKHHMACNLNKHLLITFTNRGSNMENDLNTICNIFNISNEFIKDKSFPGLHKYNNIKVNATYISYRDGAPMTTFSYQWK